MGGGNLDAGKGSFKYFKALVPNMKRMLIIALLLAVVLFSGCAQDAESRCDEPDVLAVYECQGGETMVVSELVGAGFTIVRADGTEFTCPMVAPEDLSQECLDIFREGYCSEEDLCEAG